MSDSLIHIFQKVKGNVSLKSHPESNNYTENIA